MNACTAPSGRRLTPSPLDRTVTEVMSRPLSPEELAGFGPERRKPPRVMPVVKVLTPSREDGPRGRGVFVGVRGTF